MRYRGKITEKDLQNQQNDEKKNGKRPPLIQRAAVFHLQINHLILFTSVPFEKSKS